MFSESYVYPCVSPLSGDKARVSQQLKGLQGVRSRAGPYTTIPCSTLPRATQLHHTLPYHTMPSCLYVANFNVNAEGRWSVGGLGLTLGTRAHPRLDTFFSFLYCRTKNTILLSKSGEKYQSQEAS